MNKVMKTFWLDKKMSEFINDHFGAEHGGTSGFIRKAVEQYSLTMIKRIYEPCGYANFQLYNCNLNGSVRYWYGVYEDKQFILVQHIDFKKISFINGIEYYMPEIEKQLMLGSNEDIIILHRPQFIANPEINIGLEPVMYFRNIEKTENGWTLNSNNESKVNVDENFLKFVDDYANLLDMNPTNGTLARKNYFYKLLGFDKDI